MDASSAALPITYRGTVQAQQQVEEEVLLLPLEGEEGLRATDEVIATHLEVEEVIAEEEEEEEGKYLGWRVSNVVMGVTLHLDVPKLRELRVIPRSTIPHSSQKSATVELAGNQVQKRETD